jgi:hypothetical protein
MISEYPCFNIHAHEVSFAVSTIKCSGLDPAWSKVTTDTRFPVDKETVLTVSCEEGFTLRGSNTVTCTEGTTFSSDTTPTCISFGKTTICAGLRDINCTDFT